MDAKKLRQSLDMCQQDFWGRVSVKQSAGSRYEGERNIPKPVLLLLTMAYGRISEARRTFSDLRGK